MKTDVLQRKMDAPTRRSYEYCFDLVASDNN